MHSNASAQSVTTPQDLCSTIGGRWDGDAYKCYCPSGTCSGISQAPNAGAICRQLGGSWTPIGTQGAGTCSSTLRPPDGTELPEEPSDYPDDDPSHENMTPQQACTNIEAEWDADSNRCLCIRETTASVCSGTLEAKNAATICRAIGGNWTNLGPNVGICRKNASGSLGLDDACRTVGGIWHADTRRCECLTDPGVQYCSGMLSGSAGRNRCRQLGGEWITIAGNRNMGSCRLRSTGTKPEDDSSMIPPEGTTTPKPPQTGATEEHPIDFGRFPHQGPATMEHASSVINRVKSGQQEFCRKIGGAWTGGQDGKCECNETCSQRAKPCVLGGGTWVNDTEGSGGHCTEHPWSGSTGRNIAEAELDWQLDSLKLIEPSNLGEFIECMEPTLVTPGCPYCIPAAMGAYIDDSCDIGYINPGVVYEFWWPEAEIEINNFGIAAFNPLREGRADLLRRVLATRIHTQYKQQFLLPYLLRLGINVNEAGIPGNLEDNPWAGNTIVAGEEPGDQTYHAEAHVYATSIQDRLSKKQCQGCGYFDFLYEEEWGFCFPTSPMLFNGYWKGNPEKCFYDTLDPPAKIVKAWTESLGLPTQIASLTPDTRCSGLTDSLLPPEDDEEDTGEAEDEDEDSEKSEQDRFPTYAKYWRLPGCSKVINQHMYKAALPFDWRKVTPWTFKVSLMNDEWRQKRSCLSYRLKYWGAQSPGYPDDWQDTGNEPAYRYFELSNMGVEPLELDGGDEGDALLADALDRICYFGGGELYPLVGSLTGQFTEYSSNAYLARRAIELAGQVSHEHLYNRPDRGTKQSDDEYRNHCGGEDHVNRFSRAIKAHQWEKDIDKLQRIYPDVTECFHMNEVDDRNNPLFGGKYGKLPENGSVRYIYWNKRTACSCELRGTVPHPEKNRGWALDGLPWGWGCMTYPYDNYDYGRGNVEEAETHSLLGIPALVPFCNFPYLPGMEEQSICKVADESDWQGIVDWMGDITISFGPEEPCAEDPPEYAWTPFAWTEYLTNLIFQREDYTYQY